VTDTNVFQLCQPGSFADLLTEILRNRARPLLMQAVEAEVAALPRISCRQADRRRSPAAAAPWVPAQARGDDWHRAGRRALPARP
jgi:hypothetical protein